MHFEGVSGAINVSIVAFSIVFGVLFILTATIYAMRLFASSGDKPKEGNPPAGGKTVNHSNAVAAPAAPARAAVSPQSKIVAAITAAVLTATGGRGRILSIQPVAASSRPFAPLGTSSTWRASGVVALVNNRLNRPWNR